MPKPPPLRSALACLLVASGAMAAGRQPVAASSHCGPDEQVVFSCRIGPKIASLCASQRLTPTEGHLQYRYGPPGKVEIQVPDRTLADRARIQVMRSPPSTANALAVGVESAGFTYHVFSSESVGSVSSDGMRSWMVDSGVEVRKGQTTVFSKHCTGQPDDARFLASFFVDAAFKVETDAKVWDFGSPHPTAPANPKAPGDSGFDATVAQRRRAPQPARPAQKACSASALTNTGESGGVALKSISAGPN